MNTVNLQDIERAVSSLSLDELAAFRDWFIEFDTNVWDRKFEEDVASGRLDTFAEKALNDLIEGRSTEL